MQKKNWNQTNIDREVEFKQEKNQANDQTLKKLKFSDPGEIYRKEINKSSIHKTVDKQKPKVVNKAENGDNNYQTLSKTCINSQNTAHNIQQNKQTQKKQSMDHAEDQKYINQEEQEKNKQKQQQEGGKTLLKLFQNNRKWAKSKPPMYFERLVKIQTPEFLWIGCADSRVSANEILGLEPGDIFVHRNIANLVNASDLNCLSVIQYAVDVLKVKHIIVCGHYGCGGVAASLKEDDNFGIVSNWVGSIFNNNFNYRKELQKLPESEQLNKLCEINIMNQVINVCLTTVLKDAWKRNQMVHCHGMIYDLHDGILLGLGMHITDNESLQNFREKASQTSFLPTAQREVLDNMNDKSTGQIYKEMYDHHHYE